MKTRKLTIVADENIPALTALLGDVADIHAVAGRRMTAADVAHADALLVRSVTRVDAALLQGSAVRFVGSCTIGTDHVDLAWLAENTIAFANAPGCNADAVVDYVIAGLFHYRDDLAFWQSRCVGIVGLGEVGGRLACRLAQMGIAYCAYDPFKAAATHSFEQVLACDAISLHVPLTSTGTFPTRHLFSADVLQALRPDTLLINSSRGPVIDNTALLRQLENTAQPVILDVYEDEPAPSLALLDQLLLATAHIAGYSVQGKVRGSVMVVAALYQRFAIAQPLPDLLASLHVERALPDVTTLAQALQSGYDIAADAAAFRAIYEKAQGVAAQSLAFDQYRKNYPVRNEWGFQQLYLATRLRGEAEQAGFSTREL